MQKSEDKKMAFRPFFILLSIGFLVVYLSFRIFSPATAVVPPVPGRSDSINSDTDTHSVNSDHKPEIAGDPRNQLVIGSWTDNYYGKRYLIINQDGTGEMHCQLKGLAAMMVGNTLHLQLNWHLEGDYAHFTTVGGHPKENVDAVNRLWGVNQKQKIDLLTKDEVHLNDSVSGTIYRWKRIEKVPEDAKK